MPNPNSPRPDQNGKVHSGVINAKETREWKAKDIQAAAELVRSRERFNQSFKGEKSQ